MKQLYASRFLTTSLFFGVMINSQVFGQQNVSISDVSATPNPSSVLDIISSSKGLLIPRVALTITTSQSPIVATPQTSLLVYNTVTSNDVSPGYYHWDGSKWVRFDTGNNIGDWKVKGNASLFSPVTPTTYGTTPLSASENWIGTTDAVDFVVGTNQIERLRVKQSSGKVGIGIANPLMRLDVLDASTTADDATIRGVATGAARTYGVYGNSSSATINASGVRGEANGAGSVNGVWGSSSSSSGTGVYGLASSTTGANTGVFGLNSSVAGDGVFGYNIATSGFTSGVTGFSDSPNGWGIYGANLAPVGTGSGVGVYGTTAQSSPSIVSVGVFGFNSNPTGTGIVGTGNNIALSQTLTNGSGGAFTSSNVGVYGYGTNTAGSSGVYGFSENATGTGVVAQVSATTGTALYATNSAANGTAIGPAIDARTNQTGGPAIMANLRGNTFFTNTAISAVTNNTIAGGIGVIGACDNATGVGVLGQTSGAGASFGVLGSNSGANIQAVGIYGVTSNAIAGTGFTTVLCRKSIYGQGNSAAGSYRFGIYGNGGVSPRSGGVIGHNSGGTFYSAGALGYFSGGNVDVAVYGFGGAYTVGVVGGQILYDENEKSLYASQQNYVPFESREFGLNNDDVNFDKWSDKSPNTTVGLGIYGGVMGGWIKGLVYGTNLSGVKYGLYVHGKTITNNFIATLHNTGQDERIATYAPTAMKVDVIERGKGKLQNGKVVIRFSEEFTKLISENEDLTITVTPLGSSKGLYISEYSSMGFIVLENDGGNSTLDFNWIAVGVRNGFEKPSISEEIKQRDFEVKMNGDYGVMYNDNNPQNPLYSVWFDGTKVRFDKPKSNKMIEPSFREYIQGKESKIEFNQTHIGKENMNLKKEIKLIQN